MQILNKHKIELVAWFLVLFNVIVIFMLTLQDTSATTQLSTGTRDMVAEIINTPVDVARHSWWYMNIHS